MGAVLSQILNDMTFPFQKHLPPEAMGYIRRIAVRAVEFDNVSPGKVAEVLGFCRASIYNWLSRYHDGGFESLDHRPAPGAEVKVTHQMHSCLEQWVLHSTPEDHGYDTRLWTRRILADLLEQRFGVSVDETTIGRHLRQLGLSCQKPEYQAEQQDEEQVRKFCEQTFPRIAQMAKNLNAEIVFLDEAGIGLRTRAGRTWGQQGKTPRVKAVDGKAGFNLLSSVSMNGELRFSVKSETIKSGNFIEFLDQLIKGRATPLIAIMDQASYHKSKQTKAYLRGNREKLKVFYLPVYAPQINPDEQVWNEIKTNRIGKQPVKNKDDLKRRVYRALYSLLKLPARVRSFFKMKDTHYTITFTPSVT